MGQYLPNTPDRKKSTRREEIREAIVLLEQRGHTICVWNIEKILPHMTDDHIRVLLRRMIKDHEIRVCDYQQGGRGGRNIHVYEVLELKWEK